MNIAFLAPGFSNMAGNGTPDIYNYNHLISGAELMTPCERMGDFSTRIGKTFSSGFYSEAAIWRI